MSDPYVDFVDQRRAEGDEENEIVQRLREAAKNPICPFCNEHPATLLCDFVIGPEWKGETGENRGEEYRCTSLTSDFFTCDRPICRECATQVGMMFIDGMDFHDSDTLDYCPQCQNDPRDIFLMKPVHRLEAIVRRQEMWKRSLGILKSVP